MSIRNARVDTALSLLPGEPLSTSRSQFGKKGCALVENIVPKVTAGTGMDCELEVQLALERAQFPLTLCLNDEGLTLKTKKGTVHFPRSQWLSVSVGVPRRVGIHGVDPPSAPKQAFACSRGLRL